MKAATRAAKKNRPKRFKGICADAIALNVTRVHLWQVLTGRRESKPLLKEYRELKKTGAVAASPRKGRYLNSPKPVQPAQSAARSAAADNLSPAFFAILEKLGLQVVIVRFEAGLESKIWAHPHIEESFGQALGAAQAGQYDSSHYGLGEVYHFFHAVELGKAMATLKTAIEARGLLAITSIFHAESTSALQQWYPPATAARIELDPVSEA